MAILVYLIFFNRYIYLLSNGELLPNQYKLMYNYITVSMLLYFFIDRILLKITDFLHEQFNLLCFLSVISNYFLIILTHKGVLTNAPEMFITFNGSILATTLVLLISMKRHGYFKNK